jgi:hypothetical protein
VASTSLADRLNQPQSIVAPKGQKLQCTVASNLFSTNLTYANAIVQNLFTLDTINAVSPAHRNSIPKGQTKEMNMKKIPITGTIFSTLLLALLSAMAQAEETWADDLAGMVTNGKVNFDFRYRYEFVDQEGFDENAGASTLRSRLSYTSATLNGVSFMAEVDNVSSIGAEQYNSTVNGNTEYPVVADPTGTDINQAYLKYAGETAAGIYGRQRILISNQRFVGGVGWRQNEQTFDGFRVTWKQPETFKLDYSYVYNVNRLFGPDEGANPADLHGQNHFLYGDWNITDKHKIAGFAYFLDFDPESDYPSGKTVDNSSNTYGVEYYGDLDLLKLHAAWATQSDAGNSTLDYDADYYLIDISGKAASVTLGAGYEVLGAGDGVGFKTPLATLHKFQGWADKFLSTPGDGVKDAYISIAGTVGPVKLKAVYHDFSAEEGSASFGQELDLVGTWPVNKRFSTQLKFADFSTDNAARFDDTTKAWLTLQLKI